MVYPADQVGIYGVAMTAGGLPQKGVYGSGYPHVGGGGLVWVGRASGLRLWWDALGIARSSAVRVGLAPLSGEVHGSTSSASPDAAAATGGSAALATSRAAGLPVRSAGTSSAPVGNAVDSVHGPEGADIGVRHGGVDDGAAEGRREAGGGDGASDMGGDGASEAGGGDGASEGGDDDRSSVSSSESDEVMGDLLRRMKEMLGLGVPSAPRPPPRRVLSTLDARGVAALIARGGARRIVCMCGAGMSVSAGIPDFRTPGTGLYARLAEFGLPHPQSVFEMDYFRAHPRAFFQLARDLFPGTYAPTPAHYFLVLLHSHGLLHRVYTQNIDSLEVQAGLPRGAVVAAHGNFDTAHCIDCARTYDIEHVRRAVFGDGGGVATCTAQVRGIDRGGRDEGGRRVG